MGDHTILCINVRKLLRTFLRTRVKQIAVAVHVYVDKLSKLVVVIVIGRSIAHSTLHTRHSTLDTPGDKIPVSRENLVGFIQNAYDKINSVNIKNRWIADSFKTCGLDPWSENTKRVFEAHLEKLSESRVYQALERSRNTFLT